MAKEEENKWSRERTFLQRYGGDFLVMGTSLLFLVLAIGAVGFVLLKPRVPGLSELFSDPPPPPPTREQKLNLAPGESEVILFDSNRKPLPVVPPPPPPKREQNR
jgi:hypothetical protein